MDSLERELLKLAKRVASHVKTEISHDRRDNSDELRIEMAFNGVVFVQLVSGSEANPSGLLWDIAALASCIEDIEVETMIAEDENE